MNAIVLARRDFREHDQLISCYTEGQGRLDLIARGVKKITSKNAAALEPFSFVYLGVAAGKEMNYITTVQSQEYYANIRKDIGKSMVASWIVSLVMQLVYTDEPDDRIFYLLQQTLTALSRIEHVTVSFVDIFVVHLMVLLGFTPKVGTCVFCEKEAGSAATYWFSFENGGIVCTACRDRNTPDECGITFSESDRVLLNVMLQGGDEVRTSPASLHACIFGYTQFHAGREVGDWESMRKWLV